MATNEIRQTVIIEASLTKIQGDLKTLEGNFRTSFGSIQGIARSALGAFGISLGIGSLVAFGKSVIDSAGHLVDLADQTGFAAQSLSGLKSILEENGTSVDSFAKAIFLAQKNIQGIKDESDPAAEAIRTLGLNLKELQNASPEKMFDLIATALQKVENQGQRNQLGAKVLGRSYQELAAIIPQLAGRMEEFKKQGINEDDLRKLDEFGDAWTHISNTLQIMAAGPLARVAEGFARLFDLTERARITNKLVEIGDELDRINRILERRKTLPGMRLFSSESDADLEEQRRALLKQQREMDAASNALNAQNVKKPAGGGGRVNIVDPGDVKKSADAVRSFFDGLEKQLEQAQGKLKEGLFGEGSAFGDQLDADFKRFKDKLAADKIPIPKGLDTAFERMRDSIKGANEALRTQKLLFDQLNIHDFIDEEFMALRREQREEENKINREIAERIRLLEIEKSFSGFDIVDAERGKIISDQVSKTRDLGQTLSDLRDQQQEANQLSRVLGASFNLTSVSIDIQRQKVEALSKEFNGLGQAVDEAVAELKRLEKAQLAADTVEQLIRGAGQGISDSLRSVALGTQTVGEAFKNMGVSAATALADVVFQLLVIEPLIRNIRAAMLDTSGAGFWSTLLGLGAGAAAGAFGGGNLSGATFSTGGEFAQVPFLPGRAGGGPVEAGKLYRVNEFGTEMFKPNVGGQVIPIAAQSGGGARITNTYIQDFRGAQRGVSAEVHMAIEASRKATVRESVVTTLETSRRSRNYKKGLR